MLKPVQVRNLVVEHHDGCAMCCLPNGCPNVFEHTLIRFVVAEDIEHRDGPRRELPDTGHAIFYVACQHEQVRVRQTRHDGLARKGWAETLKMQVGGKLDSHD